LYPTNYFTPALVPIIVIAIIYHIYAVYTIEVGVNNNKFEYWSSNYLGYTMSYTSTCPITYFTPKNVNINIPLNDLTAQSSNSEQLGNLLRMRQVSIET
jgi:hypothetical protein